jgi:hypothetical protein
MDKVQWELTCWNIGEPSSKAKYYKFSDSEKYCKGKVWKASGRQNSELINLYLCVIFIISIFNFIYIF